jgi:hypothetical protein
MVKSWTQVLPRCAEYATRATRSVHSCNRTLYVQRECIHFSQTPTGKAQKRLRLRKAAVRGSLSDYSQQVGIATGTRPNKQQATWAFLGTDQAALSGLRVIRPEGLLCFLTIASAPVSWCEGDFATDIGRCCNVIVYSDSGQQDHARGIRHSRLGALIPRDQPKAERAGRAIAALRPTVDSVGASREVPGRPTRRHRVGLAPHPSPAGRRRAIRSGYKGRSSRTHSQTFCWGYAIFLRFWRPPV